MESSFAEFLDAFACIPSKIGDLTDKLEPGGTTAEAPGTDKLSPPNLGPDYLLDLFLPVD